MLQDCKRTFQAGREDLESLTDVIGFPGSASEWFALLPVQLDCWEPEAAAFWFVDQLIFAACIVLCMCRWILRSVPAFSMLPRCTTSSRRSMRSTTGEALDRPVPEVPPTWLASTRVSYKVQCLHCVSFCTLCTTELRSCTWPMCPRTPFLRSSAR